MRRIARRTDHLRPAPVGPPAMNRDVTTLRVHRCQTKSLFHSPRSGRGFVGMPAPEPQSSNSRSLALRQSRTVATRQVN